MLASADAVAMVEAAYDPEPSERVWLEGLVEHGVRLVPGATRGAAFTLDASRPASPRLGVPVAVGVDRGFSRQLTHAMRSDANMARYFTHKVATASEVLGTSQIGTDQVGAFVLAQGSPDSFGCVALDAEGRGVVVCTDLSRVLRLSRALRGRWQLVAAHVAAACRLRSRAPDAERSDLDECVIAPGGRVLHAAGPAMPSAARDRLRHAVVARDRARTRAVRASPEEALALWPALVSGRWSLVDRFERDGRRYVIAQRNHPAPSAPLALSLRERQVLGHLIQGDSVKLTAYSLGLAPSTVSSLAQSVLIKLGVRSRAQLAAFGGWPGT
ncbi:MAG TPA: LuxR C-terminal-related transcriptional regulator [Polyangiaceae bacterium]|nr:LuxR C-terminal-related transcriptional regulator [Polyangiaceae bacterium]